MSDKEPQQIGMVSSKGLDNHIRKFLSEEDVTAVDMLKCCAQAIHLLHGFIKKKGLDPQEFYDWLGTMPDLTQYHTALAFCLSQEFQSFLLDAHENKKEG